MSIEIERKFALLQEQANCRDAMVDIFFPNQGGSVRHAMSFCWGKWDKEGNMLSSPCPIRRECLEYSLSCTNELQGIWGGATQRGREAIRSRMFHGLDWEDIEHLHDPRRTK